MLTAAATTLPWNQTLLISGIAAGAVLAAGLVVILARTKAPKHEPGGSVVRSWIAISLVVGLTLFTAFAFAVDDTSLRSTLIGGLTASVGSAIAFYFSSKSSDQARQDMISASAGTTGSLNQQTVAANNSDPGPTDHSFPANGFNGAPRHDERQSPSPTDGADQTGPLPPYHHTHSVTYPRTVETATPHRGGTSIAMRLPRQIQRLCRPTTTPTHLGQADE